MNAIRHNPYTLIHKGLRACMTDVLVIVGRIDPHDADDVATAARAVREMLDFARSHLQHEEDWIHTALEARRTGSSAETRTDHLQHREAFTLLEASLRALEDSLTPAEVALAMRWMLPSASAPERAGVLAAMQRTAPRPAFEGCRDPPASERAGPGQAGGGAHNDTGGVERRGSPYAV